MSKLVVDTAATAKPLTASDLRTHLRIDDAIEGAYLDELIVTARKTLEEVYWTQFITATYDQYFDRFASVLKLRKPPVGTVASVKYTAEDGTLTTVATSVWEQGLVDGVGIVRCKYNQTWPSGVRGHPDSVVVQFTAGYGSAATDVPEPIRHAMKLLCGHLYEHREMVVVGTIVAQIPLSVKSLMTPYSFKEPRR